MPLNDEMCMFHPKLDEFNERVNHSNVCVVAKKMLKYGYTIDLVRVFLVLLEDV